jgi:hypothetical protein
MLDFGASLTDRPFALGLGRCKLSMVNLRIHLKARSFLRALDRAAFFGERPVVM